MSKIIRESLDIVNLYRLNEEVLYEKMEEPIIEEESANRKIVDYDLLMTELDNLKFKLESTQLSYNDPREGYNDGYNHALNGVAAEMVENLMNKLRDTGE